MSPAPSVVARHYIMPAVCAALAATFSISLFPEAWIVGLACGGAGLVLLAERSVRRRQSGWERILAATLAVLLAGTIVLNLL